jgi:hypothetical protein
MPNYCLRWNEDALRDGFSALVDGSWGSLSIGGIAWFCVAKKRTGYRDANRISCPLSGPPRQCSRRREKRVGGGREQITRESAIDRRWTATPFLPSCSKLNPRFRTIVSTRTIATPCTGRNRRSATFWTGTHGARRHRRSTGSTSDRLKPALCFCIEAEVAFQFCFVKIK